MHRFGPDYDDCDGDDADDYLDTRGRMRRHRAGSPPPSRRDLWGYGDPETDPDFYR